VVSVLRTYRLRLERKRRLLRAARKSRELRPVADRTARIRRDDLLLFCTLRNERVRLPFFLAYYRALGIGHFLFVDNGSTDGSGGYLAGQPDCSVWTTGASYKRARFGMDWITWLQRRHGHGHWTLVVDVDEFFVYPFCETRPLRALTDWLDASSIRSFGAMLLDLYPDGPVAEARYRAGDNPVDSLPWFDSGNYTIRPNPVYRNLWIQGGPRARVFFPHRPAHAPALNKIPLVRWHRSYVYASSTHMLLPRGLNLVYDEWGGEKASGCLLHTKFLDTFADKAAEESARREHYAASREYRAYDRAGAGTLGFRTPWSERYEDWRQLESLGLISRGNWA